MKSRKTSTDYIIQLPWQRSPEIWGTVGKWLVIAYIAGGISVLYVQGNHEEKPRPCKIEQKQETTR